nr:CpaD family pilus assembly protein [Pseudaminobacter soli]
MISKTRPSGAPVPFAIRTASRPVLSMVVALATGLLSGCVTPPDSVIVGSVPDDYRTRHPIVIAEKEQVIDLPVGASDRGMTRMQRTALGGFLSDYDRSAAPVLAILVPVGSRNELAASHAARDFAHFAKKHGVPASRVLISSYQAGSIEVSAPVRVMYSAMKAQTDRCGRWPADIAETTDNKQYFNFGCSYQNNLAAQVADPADLLGPRKMTPPDAERRGIVIDDYREAPTWIDPPVREIDY